MEAEVSQSPVKSPIKTGKSKTLLISLLAAIFVLLAAAVGFTYMTLNNQNVYKGVHVGSLDAGGLTKAEMLDRLKQTYAGSMAGSEITLEAGGLSEKANLTDLDVAYDVDAAALKAYSIGRNGSVIDRISDIIAAGTGGINIDLPIIYNNEKVQGLINSFYDKTLKNVKEADVLIQDDRVTIRSGIHGESVDRDKVASGVEELVKAGKGGTVAAEIIVTPPSKLNTDDLLQQINREPADAGFVTANGSVTVTPHVVGRKIGKTTLESVATDLENSENTEKVLPVEFVKPKITTADAHAKLFKDELAYMSTHFSASTQNDKNRGENIKLAVAKINGKILAPGQTFSFNETVGPRTAEGGYQTAHTYTAGKVVDGIGGGICQVSSTLYNAVLKADLNVVERRNHMFTVGYVPYGQDATVSYGTTDFRFSNSTSWPIKIAAGVTDKNNVYFSFLGTKDQTDKSVIITNQTIKKTPFTTVYINDPNLAEGKETVRQNGMDGYVVDTFKTVKVDGKVVSQTKLYTSKYQPLAKEVVRGTKKSALPAEPPVETEPSVTTTPSTGVDDADNPPAVE